MIQASWDNITSFKYKCIVNKLAQFKFLLSYKIFTLEVICILSDETIRNDKRPWSESGTKLSSLY